ncbi:non-ribosomal peptide synthetase [Pectobacteriaceae bacterium CE90]|nr:non-ribosomal peptide synthetase [Pectobacteriaceae bacterium CE90]
MTNVDESRLKEKDADAAAFSFAPQTLPDLVRYQARHNPLRPALLSEEGELTFAQLDERSNSLAQALAELGIGYGDRIALQGEKSLMFVLLQLAVLKLGAAFISLAPGVPAARRERILKDAEPAALIIADACLQPGEAPTDLPKRIWSELAQRASQLPAQDPAFPVSGADIAWVLYTSGSTGTPKGVVGTHDASLKRCAAMAALQPVSAGEVIAHLMPDTAIDAIWEVWAPLGFGLPLVLIDAQRYSDLKQLVALLARRQVTQICIVPSYLKLLLNSGINLAESLPLLNMWISTGESASSSLAALFFQRLPQAKLLNQYGLTETLATATCFTMTQAPCDQGTVAIGKAISHIATWVLDDDFRPCAAKEVGHLGISGPALALGYLASPALTAERFCPNPFAKDGSRLYLSGDLAAMDADGDLHYHGRQDRRINILGHRVELGEIEAELGEVAGVHEVGVTGRERNGQMEIFGFYTASDAVTGEQLMQHLNARLPCYMHPLRLWLLPTLPKLPGGKVDYRALTEKIDLVEPAAVRSDANLEQRLLAIVSKLLEVEIPHIEANFFDYGGNSVSAIRLINELDRQEQVVLAIEDVYNASSLSALAEVIEHKKSLREAG